MRASIRSIDFDPDPRSLPADPSAFAFGVRLIVGPADGPGDESFDLAVCSPQWLAEQSRQQGIIDGRHLAIVNVDAYDERELRAWLEQRVSAVEGATWREVGERLSRLGYWEFEDYRE